MIRSELLFQTPYWFIAFCFLAGAAYAFLLYRPVGPWGKYANWALAAARALGVGLIVFLLLNPLVRNVSSQLQKAQIIIALDNSASLGAYSTKIKAIGNSLADRLRDEGFEPKWENLSGTVTPIDSLQFDFPETDLSSLLASMKKGYQGEHLTDVILLSDGIVNQGSSPTYQQYPFRVHTLAVGDTTPVTDLWVQDVIHNKVAYLGNKFPIKAEIAAKGLLGKSTTVFLKQAGKVIAQENIRIDRDEYFKAVNFEVSSNQKGMQRYSIVLAPLQGEHTTVNNARDVFIDIIDGRQRILLLAASPHPDIKAMKGMLETDDNFEITTQILSVSGTVLPSTQAYDLVILHQIPNALNLGNELLRDFLDKRVPLLFVLGNQSSISGFNAVNKAVQIGQSGQQTDRVRGQLNPAFSQLNLNVADLEILSRLPPLSVPFGDYSLRKGAEVVLYQKVGSVQTTKPLLLVHTSDQGRSAVLLGEGIWEWRQEEYALTGNHRAVNELFQKIAQLISVKEDKRKFRVYSTKASYRFGESTLFRTEIYNDVFEPVYGQEIRLELTDDQENKKEYQYRHTAESEGYQISGLSAGAYRYIATGNLNGETVTASGEFIVAANDKELAHTTADFGMLRELALQSGGQFLKEEGLDDFVKRLADNRPADRLDASESLTELIRFRWLFFLLIGLLALEWGMRKYLGGY